MSAEFFLDTNVFVYSFDTGEKRKLARARQLVREALDSRRGTISWQVVQEFLSAALHRFTQPLAAAEAEDYLATVLSPLCRVFPSAQLYREALLIQKENSLPFLRRAHRSVRRGLGSTHPMLRGSPGRPQAARSHDSGPFRQEP